MKEDDESYGTLQKVERFLRKDYKLLKSDHTYDGEQRIKWKLAELNPSDYEQKKFKFKRLKGYLIHVINTICKIKEGMDNQPQLSYDSKSIAKLLRILRFESDTPKLSGMVIYDPYDEW